MTGGTLTPKVLRAVTHGAVPTAGHMPPTAVTMIPTQDLHRDVVLHVQE